MPTNFKGSRRAITLVHPDTAGGTSNTLVMAVQLVKAGEAVYAHRHTAAAMRFILEGGKDTYTVTDGEKCIMERGDLVVQPNWSWHNHVNESDRDSVWIDALDVGLMAMLRTMFQEPHPAEQVKLFNSATDNTVRNPANLAPPGSSPKETDLQVAGDASRPEGDARGGPGAPTMAVAWNTATRPREGPTFPTFSCWIQMLDPGERTLPHRHTANHLCHGFSGSGVIEVEGNGNGVGRRRLRGRSQLELAPAHQQFGHRTRDPILHHGPSPPGNARALPRRSRKPEEHTLTRQAGNPGSQPLTRAW